MLYRFCPIPRENRGAELALASSSGTGDTGDPARFRASARYGLTWRADLVMRSQSHCAIPARQASAQGVTLGCTTKSRIKFQHTKIMHLTWTSTPMVVYCTTTLPIGARQNGKTPTADDRQWLARTRGLLNLCAKRRCTETWRLKKQGISSRLLVI